jgi:hypothetical protein
MEWNRGVGSLNSGCGVSRKIVEDRNCFSSCFHAYCRVKKLLYRVKKLLYGYDAFSKEIRSTEPDRPFVCSCFAAALPYGSSGSGSVQD